MKTIKIWSVALGAVVFAGIASADPTCTTATLVNASETTGTVITVTGEFTGASSSCNLNGLDFSNFQIEVGAGYVTAANLDVTVSFSAPDILSFSENLSAQDDIVLEYSVTPGVGSISLTDGAGNGSTGVNESVCSSQVALSGLNAFSCQGTILGSGTVGQSGSTTITVAPSATDYVVKDVNGESEMTQGLSSVPEPATFSLLGAGLLGLGMIGRKLRK